MNVFSFFFFIFLRFHDIGFSVNFYHGGNFVRDWLISYKGGNETLMEGLDEDRWSYFEITSIVENDLNVKNPYRLWWDIR